MSYGMSPPTPVQRVHPAFVRNELQYLTNRDRIVFEPHSSPDQVWRGPNCGDSLVHTYLEVTGVVVYEEDRRKTLVLRQTQPFEKTEDPFPQRVEFFDKNGNPEQCTG